MDKIEIIVKGILLAYLFTRFEPVQTFLINLNKMYKNILTDLGLKMLSCLKCLSFWIILFMSYDIYLSIIGFIISFYYDKNLSQWEKRIKL